MGKADRISGLFWFLFSVAIGIESYRLGLGTLRQPGPGFLFFWTSVAVGIMSLVVLVRAWAPTKTGIQENPLFGKKGLAKIIPAIVSLFLYAFFMESLGFIPVTLFLFLFLLKIIEKRSWAFTLLTSVLVTGMAYLIFEVWLQCQLPKGLLGFMQY